MKAFLSLCALVLLLACNSGFGNKLVSEKLEIYYDNKNLQSYADSLGKFWTNNNLVGAKKQFLKLTKTNKVFEVRIIKSQEFKEIPVTEKESFLIEELRTKLQTDVFQNKNTRIVICDNSFKEIINK